jgi:PTS system fructose-specific IIA component
MIIDEKLICMNLDVKSKVDAIEKMSRLAKVSGRLIDQETYCQSVFTREGQVSTDMGLGIAIPHGKSDSVIDPFIVFARLKNEIVWNEDDESLVKLVFLIGVPAVNQDTTHLKIISQLAGKLTDDEFINDLRLNEDSDTVLKIFESILI